MHFQTPNKFTALLFLSALAGVLLVAGTSGADAIDFGLVDAWQKKNIRALQRYNTTYRNTPIEPYLFAGQINAREAAQGTLNQSVQRGLERFAGVPPVEKLRAGLLKEWARQKDWKPFGEHIDRIPTWLAETDTDLACATLLFRSARGKNIASMRADLFHRTRDFSPICAEALTGTVSSGAITADQAMTKLASLAAFSSRGASLRFLQAVGSELPAEKVRSASALVDILHATRDDFDDGKKELSAHNSKLDAATLRLATTHVGILGTRKHASGGHALIRSVDGYRLSLAGSAAEWRTRAAIMASSWSDVLASVESMPPALRSETIWGYWYSRALQKLGKTAEARLLLTELSRQPGFYGLLAAEQSKIRPPYLADSPQPDPALVHYYLKRPEAQRAKALHKAGLWVEAAHEWKALMHGADSRAYLAAAHAAAEMGMIDRQIGLAIRATSHFDLGLRYPLVHEQEVLSASSAAHIAPELTWAIIRQESRFVAHAVSSAGAVGLMQLMPATAKRVAARAGMKAKPTRQVLVEPSPNIELGTAFLSSLLRSYKGNVAYAAAAYNAGPGRVARWRNTLGTMEIERFVELIPFDETRDYTKQVLANYVLYAQVRGKQPIRLLDVLNRME